MNINWPNVKAAASASGNVLNMPGSKEEVNSFKALFASQLQQMWQDYRETGLTAAEQKLKEAGGEEALHQECRLDEVAAIVVAAERLDCSGSAVEPVGVGSVETLGLAAKETHDGAQTSGRLLAGYESTLHRHGKRHDAKARTSGSDSFVGAEALAREAAHRVAIIPEILESPLLHLG